MAKKTSPISIEVTVDENNIPERILWSAPDGGVDKEVTQAILLALLLDQPLEEVLIVICTLNHCYVLLIINYFDIYIF